MAPFSTFFFIFFALSLIHLSTGFLQLPQQPCQMANFQSQESSAVVLQMAGNNEEEFIKNMARAARKPSATDRVIEMSKPLGLVLEEDEKQNIYIKSAQPGSNAVQYFRSGKIKEGDQLTMISATFGDEMWSTRGVGLGMVMQSVKIRAGNNVAIVVETPKGAKQGKSMVDPAIEKKRLAQEKAAKNRKSDAELLAELDETDEKLKKKKFFGLF